MQMKLSLLLVSQLCHTTWFIYPIKVKVRYASCWYTSTRYTFTWYVSSWYAFTGHVSSWLLTSYDIDCDIVADAKCRSASVPIIRYISHIKDIEFFTFQMAIFCGLNLTSHRAPFERALWTDLTPAPVIKCSISEYDFS